ncbi:MAG: ABC transporter permease, partial [Turicibacter sp.]
MSKKYDKKQFERTVVDFKDGEEIKTESLNFWQDAFRRLKQNKPSIISLYAIALLIACSLLLPFIGPKHADGSYVRYDQTPNLVEPDTGLAIAKGRLNYLPPRIPGLEKIGIADGSMKKTMTTQELFVGERLPEEIKKLNSPLTKAEFVEAVGVKYHPYDYTIESWSGEGATKEVTIKLNGTSTTETLPVSELMSEYSSYKNLESFEFMNTQTDAYGIQMLTVDVNLYVRNNIEHLYFYFGTDELGFDLWTRLWSGIQVSLLIGIISLIIDFTVGILYGSIAGYYGGTWIDNLMMRFTEVLGSIPTTVIVILFLTIKEPFVEWIEKIIHYDLSPTQGSFIMLVIALSITGWIGVARVVRAQYLKLKDQEFVMASITLGASNT